MSTGSKVERATRIELAFSAWEADVLPLNYARVGVHRIAAVTGAGPVGTSWVVVRRCLRG